MKSKESGDHKQVREFLDKLEHPLMREIEEIRKIILNANAQLTEHIKWHAPSFCVDGEDRLTLKLFPPKNIQIVFHRGAKVKISPKEKLISDDSDMLQWSTNDRAVATFTDMTEIKSKEGALSNLINRWIEAAKLALG